MIPRVPMWLPCASMRLPCVPMCSPFGWWVLVLIDTVHVLRTPCCMIIIMSKVLSVVRDSRMWYPYGIGRESWATFFLLFSY
jgi:hypothetical protein